MRRTPHGDALARRLVPDKLWQLTADLLPPAKVRPQGGGRPRVDDRAVFASVVFVLTCGCAWRQIPACFGVAAPTAYRRFVEWSQFNLFTKLPADARAANLDAELLDWVVTIAEAAGTRTEQT